MRVDQPVTRKEKLRGQPTVTSILLNISACIISRPKHTVTRGLPGDPLPYTQQSGKRCYVSVCVFESKYVNTVWIREVARPLQRKGFHLTTDLFFFRIPKVSILENYQFLFAFDWPVYSCFFSVSRQRSLKFVCARVCVFVWLWCLLDSDLCFCFLFFTERKQNNIVADMDMHCFKKKKCFLQNMAATSSSTIAFYIFWNVCEVQERYKLVLYWRILLSWVFKCLLCVGF